MIRKTSGEKLLVNLLRYGITGDIEEASIEETFVGDWGKTIVNLPKGGRAIIFIDQKAYNNVMKPKGVK